jgi:hypothetical protein
VAEPPSRQDLGGGGECVYLASSWDGSIVPIFSVAKRKLEKF